MPRAGPKNVRRFSLEFKLKAVTLSQLKGVEVQAVADALEIHPFMLSRWRKEAREGRLRGHIALATAVTATPTARETRGFQRLQRAHALLQKEHALLKRLIRFASCTKADAFAFIEQERTGFGVTRLCRLFGVTRAGFYAWRHRPVSAPDRQDRMWLEEMRAIFEQSGGTYGSPRLHRELVARGHRIGRRRVERLMRVGGWRARAVRVYRRTAGTHRWFGQHPNRVQRRQARRLNQIWVGDLTYLWAAGRWWYLVVILDQCSRRVLAWRVTRTRDARTTWTVLAAALRRRRPQRGLIVHTDRGSEFLGAPLKIGLARAGIRQSMTRGGAPDENAHVESFFHSLKAERTKGTTFGSVGDLRRQWRAYIRYYNHHRLHSALDYRSPVDYEREAA